MTYSPQHNAFFAASGAHGSLWRIDRELVRAQKVSLSAPIRNACGLALRAASPAPGLCVRTPRDAMRVDFGPDQRSAYVRSTPCTDRPWLLSQLPLKGD